MKVLHEKIQRQVISQVKKYVFSGSNPRTGFKTK